MAAEEKAQRQVVDKVKLLRKGRHQRPFCFLLSSGASAWLVHYVEGPIVKERGKEIVLMVGGNLDGLHVKKITMSVDARMSAGHNAPPLNAEGRKFPQINRLR